MIGQKTRTKIKPCSYRVVLVGYETAGSKTPLRMSNMVGIIDFDYRVLVLLVLVLVLVSMYLLLLVLLLVLLVRVFS